MDGLESLNIAYLGHVVTKNSSLVFSHIFGLCNLMLFFLAKSFLQVLCSFEYLRMSLLVYLGIMVALMAHDFILLGGDLLCGNGLLYV